MPVALHEGVDVAFVPANLLIRKELRDRGAVFVTPLYSARSELSMQSYVADTET